MLNKVARGFYLSYDFRDHDPILDEVDTLIQKTGTTSAYIERKSGVTASTLRKWRTRRTKRPQFSTVKAVVKAVGGELSIVYQGKRIKSTLR